jgi:hypothetical protein
LYVRKSCHVKQDRSSKNESVWVFFNDRNLTLDGIAIVKHSMAIHNQLRKKLGSREHKKFNNSASRKRIKERFSKKWGEKGL